MRVRVRVARSELDVSLVHRNQFKSQSQRLFVVSSSAQEKVVRHFPFILFGFVLDPALKPF